MQRSLDLIRLLLFSALAVQADESKPHHRLPLLASVFPQGAQPGTKLQVEVMGEFLDRVQSFVPLDDAIRGTVLDVTPTRLKLDLEVAATAALGPHYFRVVSLRGASNILLFRVGDQPHVFEVEPNSTMEQAQEVRLPATINARMNVDGDFDFFRFRAEAGSTWIFDLRSARNGNGLDGALILLDSLGRKLEHKEETFIWDPFFSFTFRQGGNYYLVVQPTHTRLDPTFAYQLDIRTAPHLDTVAPLSFAPGVEAEATLFGAGLTRQENAKLWFDAKGFSGDVLDLRGSSARVKIKVPADARPGEYQLAVVTASGRSSPATFLVDKTPAHPGGESISAPVSITGIVQYRKPERFSFSVEKDETLVFEVRAQRFGSPVDSVLRILDSSGKQVVRNDDGSFPGAVANKDSLILHKFAEAGKYSVELRNLVSVTGEQYPYQLIVRKPAPSVDLMLATDQPTVPIDGESKLKVTAVRIDAYDGPVALRVKNLPPGVKVEAIEIPAGKNDAELTLHSGGAKAGVFGNIEIVSDAAPGPAWRSVRLSSGGGEGSTNARVDKATLVVVEPLRFSLEADATNLTLVRGGMVEIPIVIRRAVGFQDEIQFRLENGPAGVKLEPAVATADKDKILLRLRADPAAPAGRYARVSVLGSTADGRIEEAPKISIEVN